VILLANNLVGFSGDGPLAGSDLLEAEGWYIPFCASECASECKLMSFYGVAVAGIVLERIFKFIRQILRKINETKRIIAKEIPRKRPWKSHRGFLGYASFHNIRGQVFVGNVFK